MMSIRVSERAVPPEKVTGAMPIIREQITAAENRIKGKSRVTKANTVRLTPVHLRAIRSSRRYTAKLIPVTATAKGMRKQAAESKYFSKYTAKRE